MLRRSTVAVLATAVLLLPCAAESFATATPAPVTVLGAKGPRTVTLSPQDDGTLTGTLTLFLRLSDTDEKPLPRLRIRFYPASGARVARAPGDGPLSLVDSDDKTLEMAPRTKAGDTVLHLRFTVPKQSPPSAVDGQLSIARSSRGSVAIVEIDAKADQLPGVAFQPAKLTIRTTSWFGPFHDAPDKTERVELVGPGVPTLFAGSRARPDGSVLLIDGAGHQVHVVLKELTQGESALVASAKVTAQGDLGPGDYEGDLPVSTLAPDGPKLSVKVTAKQAIWWALLAVLVGALGSLLTTTVAPTKRRKKLLRTTLRAVLAAYEPTLEKQRLLLWRIDGLDLENKDRWFKTQWSVLPSLDGVQGIWSSIAHARTNGDLDDDQELVLDLRSKVESWLIAAGPVGELRAAHDDEPGKGVGALWQKTETWLDTGRLLSEVALFPPKDDTAAGLLVERIRLQTIWHEAFAAVWDRLAVVEGLMTDPEYTNRDHGTLEEVKKLMPTLDERASPEAKRTRGDLVDLLQELASARDQLEELQKKVPTERSPAMRATRVGQLAPHEMIALVGDLAPRRSPEPMIQETAQRETVRSLAALAQRDILWTAATALVTAAVFLLATYGETWGSGTDYGKAFAAGFLGKIGIDWATTPAFQSLRLRRRPVTPTVTAETSTPTAGAVTEGAAPLQIEAATG